MIWFGWCLVWGRPLDIDHFAERSALERVYRIPEAMSVLHRHHQILQDYDRQALAGQELLTYDYLLDLPGDEWGVYQKLLTTALSPELLRDLLRTALTTLEEDARPAYGRLGDYLRSLAESAPETAGIWQLPGGDDYYRAVLRRQMEASLR